MNELWETVWKIWTDGGWLMGPLAVLGLMIYSSIFSVILYLNHLLQRQADQDQWAHWIDKPEEANGSIGSMVCHAQEECHSIADIRSRVLELKRAHLGPIDNRLKLSMVLVGAAPLTGLLGTVTGMLTTFAGIGTSVGGNTIDLVAGGISEALITTQTGLVLAIPGYILLHMAKRKRQTLDIFFNQLEILTLQSFQRRGHLST